jgi:hypothetical protein
MPSTYTTSGIELIGDGEQSGTWGSTTNDNLQILDRMVSQAGSISLSGTTHTLTVSDGTLSDGQYAVLVFGGSPSGTNTVTITPNDAKRTYFVKNDSGESVVLTQGSGGNVTVADGGVAIVYCDGAGTGAEVVDISGLTSGDIGVTVQAYSSILQNTTASFTTADETKLDGINQGVATTDSPSFAGLTVDTSTLYVDSANDRVGIGLTGPAVQLDQLGSDLMHRLRSTTSTNAYARYQGTTGIMAVGIIAGSGYVGTTDATALKIVTDSSERMRITSGGDVGIGTSSPTVKLDVRSSGAGIARITSTGSGSSILYFSDIDSTGGFAQSIGSVGDDLRALTGSTERLRITSGGDVGIGTSSPSEKLSVSGNISVTGTVDGRDVAADGAALDAATTAQDTAVWETGTGTDETVVSPAKVKAAIEALAPSSVGSALSWSSWSNGSESSVAHSLGSAPTIWFAHMECTSADAGFSVGDIVPINYSHSSAGYNGATTYADATNIYLRVGSGGFNTYSSSGVYTSDFDPAKWTAKVRIIS